MDPLSIIASSLTVAGALQLTLQAFAEASQANSDIVALANELADVHIVLVHANEILEHGNTSLVSQSLIAILISIKAGLVRVHEHVTKWTGGSAISEETSTQRRLRAVKKPVRWMTAVKVAKRLRDDLRSSREQLITVLSTHTASTSNRIRLELQAVHLLTESIHARIIPHRIGGDIQDLPTSEEHSSSTEDDEADETTLVDQDEAGADMTALAQLPTIVQEPSFKGVGIRITQYSRTPCASWCSCACHREHRLQSPQLLDTIFGTIFLGYSGLPVTKSQCDQRSCQHQSPPVAYATYMFPRWFLSQMISLVVSSTPYGSPIAALTITRTIPADAHLFVYAKSGDVVRIKDLLQKRLASPNDVHHKTGVTALHFAIAHQRFDVCKLLLDAGADPFLSNKSNPGSAADKAWSRILSNSLSTESERALRALFSGSEALERRDFNVLHKIVANLCSKPLEAELQASTANINDRDSLGRTPLSLAAERGDADAVRLLLHYGADPSLAAYSGSSPLRYAATSHNAKCVQLLLDAGADVRTRTDFNQTALHYAAAHNSDPTHAKYLLKAGADPNAADNDGRTPLGFTPIQDHFEVAQVLLQHGARIGREGKAANPLVQVIHMNRHRLLTLFLKYGVSTDVEIPRRQTLLHIIAENADMQTMELLSTLDFSHIDLSQIDDDGMTAWELLIRRGKQASSLRDLFVKLSGRSWTMEAFYVAPKDLHKDEGGDEVIDGGESEDDLDEEEIWHECN